MRWQIVLLCLVALGPALISRGFAKAFKDSSLSGSYIFEIVEDCSSSFCPGPFNGIGSVAFDGEGSANANLLLNHAGGISPDTATGTYSVDPNGTGHLTLIRADTPAPTTGVVNTCPSLNSLDFVIADPPASSAEYTDTGTCLEAGGSSFDESSFGTLFMRPADAHFTNATLSGNYLVRYFQSSGGVLLPGVGGGLLTFDGISSVTGSVGFGGFGTATVSGTYSVNSDGSATIQFPSGTSFVSNENWSLLISDGIGTHSVFIDTSNNSGTNTVGTLEKQR